MQQLGRYEIETYYVVVNSTTETRQRIVYIGNNGEDYFIERYIGNIRDGYGQSNTYFKNLLFTNIKSHIPGESIVILDNGVPAKPQIYLSISSIESIQRDGEFKLIIIDSQIDPVTLEFLTYFDCNQAYSMMNYLLENPLLNLDDLISDLKAPVIFFNEYFFGTVVNLDIPFDRGFGTQPVGPFSTEDGSSFRIDIDLSTFIGPLPITKSDILSGLIYDITDDRDSSVGLVDSQVLIYRDVVSLGNEVNDISGVGNFLIRFHLHDLSQNQNTSTIIISVI
jgi:hypothetical protein